MVVVVATLVPVGPVIVVMVMMVLGATLGERLTIDGLRLLPLQLH